MRLKYISSIFILFCSLQAELSLALSDHDIAKDQAWQALLVYSPRNIGSPSSLVDDPAFFLSPVGKYDPLDELVKNLARARSEEMITQSSEESFLCRFPARYEFLKTHYKDLKRDVEECARTRQYLDAINPEAASLVFSSYYLSNPASMMGHTFLRFHSKTKVGGISSPLLDYALNFAANPTAANPLLYMYLGMFGGFPGTFSLQPYHQKIAEYAQYESRDMWEYKLDLTPVDVRRLLLMTLDVGPYYINYFYMDENCSYIMLFLIDAARPGLHLAKHFRSIVTPSDTIKLVHEKGLVSEIRLIPSQRTRFLDIYDRLSPAERKIFETALVNTKIAANDLRDLSEPKQAHILDAIVEYIHFEEKLIGDRRAEVYGNLLGQALLLRAQSKAPPPPEIPMVATRQPHLTHYNKRLSLGFRQEYLNASRARDSYIQIVGRPSFHDLETFGLGLPPTHGIQLGKTVIDYSPEKAKFYLQEFSVVEIQSMQSFSRVNRIPAWKIHGGMKREFGYRDPARKVNDFFLAGGPGVAMELLDGSFLLALYTDVGVHVASEHDKNSFVVHGGITPQINIQFPAYTRLNMYTRQLAYSYGAERHRWESRLSLASEVYNGLHAQIYFQDMTFSHEAGALLNYYF